MQRVAGGTYVSGQRQQPVDLAAAVTPGFPCGHADEFGRCGARYHSPDCGSLADPEVTQGLISAGVYRQIAERPGAPGSSGTLADHVEAITGQRLRHRETLFDTGTRPLFSPERRAVTADLDGPYSYPVGIPGSAWRTVAAVRAQDGRMGLQPTAHERGLDRLTANALAARPHARRLAHPDYAESTRERNARLKQPAALRLLDEGVNGSVPTYANGW